MCGQVEEEGGHAEEHRAAGDKDADGDQLMLSIENTKIQPKISTQPLSGLQSNPNWINWRGPEMQKTFSQF